MIRILCLALYLVLLPGCQENDSEQSAGIERVRIVAPRVSIRPGEVAEGELRLEIKDGYHIQANPVPLRYLIPAELVLEEGGVVELGTTSYPEGTPYSLHGSPDTLLVYDGVVIIPFTLSLQDSVVVGNYQLGGTVTYQACDDRMCFPPVKESLILHVRVI